MVGENSAGLITLPGATSRIFYLPFQFWFNRNAGLALPLIALQYHEVKFIVEFRTAAQLVYNPAVNSALASNLSMTDCNIWIDYIYLDTDERRRFAQTSHEYLIEQLQFTGSTTVEGVTNGSNVRTRMDFNHPCKYLVWDLRGFESNNEWNNYTNRQGYAQYVDALGPAFEPGFYGKRYGECAPGYDVATNTEAIDPVAIGLIQLNGHDRFDQRYGNYFNLVQPSQHFTRIPCTGINVYSFSLNPVEHQPSGTCNMSRIDNATLSLTVTSYNFGTLSGVSDAQLYIWTTNYNVLRVTSGMGGIAYSN